MKLKFRKGKPPVKILERGELKHIATQKMKKAAKLIEAVPLPIIGPLLEELGRIDPKQIYYHNGQGLAKLPIGKDGQVLDLKGWRDPTEEEKKQMEAEIEKRRTQAALDIQLLFCPLCKKALSLDNVHEVTLNGQKRQIHKTCPEEKQ
jgi:hypothetical protein